MGRYFAISMMLLAACGSSEEEESGFIVRTNLVPIAGEVRVQLEGEEWLLHEEKGTVDACGAGGAEVGGGTLTAKAEAGWVWSLEVDAAECAEYELHLGNTRSPFYSIMTHNPDDLPLQVYLDDQWVGSIEEILSREMDEYFYELGAVEGDLKALRKAIGEAALRREALVLTGEPGVYRLRIEDASGSSSEEEIRLDEQLVSRHVRG